MDSESLAHPTWNCKYHISLFKNNREIAEKIVWRSIFKKRKELLPL